VGSIRQGCDNVVFGDVEGFDRGVGVFSLLIPSLMVETYGGCWLSDYVTFLKGKVGVVQFT